MFNAFPDSVLELQEQIFPFPKPPHWNEWTQILFQLLWDACVASTLNIFRAEQNVWKSYTVFMQELTGAETFILTPPLELQARKNYYTRIIGAGELYTGTIGAESHTASTLGVTEV